MREGSGQDWRPSASLDVLALRASLLARLRGWFADHGVMEVETPVLSAAAVTDPHLQTMETRAAGLSRYLHTSPEFCMKRLLAAGAGDIYQICRVFRDGEQGRRLHTFNGRYIDRLEERDGVWTFVLRDKGEGETVATRWSDTRPAKVVETWSEPVWLVQMRGVATYVKLALIASISPLAR